MRRQPVICAQRPLQRAICGDSSFDSESIVGSNLDRHDDRVGSRDHRRAVVNQQEATTVLRIQIHRRLPQDAVQRLRWDGGNCGVLRVVPVAGPRNPNALRFHAAG